MSGALGDTPLPAPQPMGSPRHPAPANQLQPQQRGLNQQAGLRPTGPQQQQKPPGAQVSGPPFSPAKQAGPTAQSKGPAQPSPAKAQPSPAKTAQTSPAKGEPSPAKQTGPTTQSKGPAQPSPAKGALSSAKTAYTPAKGTPSSAKQTGLTAQSKGSAQPSPVKFASTPTKGAPSPTKSAPTQPKPNKQAGKQQQGQDKAKVVPKAHKENEAKASPKKGAPEAITTSHDEKKKLVEDSQKSKHHDVSSLQLFNFSIFTTVILLDLPPEFNLPHFSNRHTRHRCCHRHHHYDHYSISLYHSHPPSPCHLYPQASAVYHASPLVSFLHVFISSIIMLSLYDLHYLYYPPSG